MTSQEFKERYPHLAHLEGNELWDAMAMAVKRVEVPPMLGDGRIVDTVDIGDGYTLGITQGFDRTWKEFMKDVTPPEFSNFGFLMPCGELPKTINVSYNSDEQTKTTNPNQS